MRRASGFSLVELMVAMVFVCIAFFGYVALHSRLLHSGQRLEGRETGRSATDFYFALLSSRLAAGVAEYPDGRPMLADPEVPGLYRVSTAPPTDTGWLRDYPAELGEGFSEAEELDAQLMLYPYDHEWSKR